MRAVKIDPVNRTDLVELVQIDADMVMVCDESVFAQGYAPTREGKCKAVEGAFTFIGWGTVIAGTAIILGGDSDKFKALPENLASFQMMTEWVEPADVPPSQHTIIAF